MKKRILCLVSVLCLLLGIFGAASAEVDGLKKIGFACMKNDPFMVPLCNGMQEVCDANGIELIVYYADNDIEKQISQCDDLLQQNIDGLIVMPVDFEGITPALDAAAKAGVPVVMLKRPSLTSLPITSRPVSCAASICWLPRTAPRFWF